ncbi:TonB-dependent receptor [Pseudomaricurvus alkylphenolicus]|uniref:TonB-dependent receptor n=1 Tax=Pseudomaricurvus alkylphenolicus TaxID=1306991 RepID=UPI00141D8E7C|nr:TonB-dependent receptor [Pseudomaricurvus alkylphenolicus]NIB40809.1 TonB-dependent receptor [Pseudomaricurvus alkylphenolicus]
MKHNHHRTLLALAVACLTGAAGAAEFALEEVVVTAQKRAQSLQEVPIAVSVMGGDKIDKMGVANLEELSAFAPNVQINEAATQQTVFIRGIGSGANHGFEQSVGTFIDGVYFGRGRSTRSPFLDIERVEVLKGPQGVLFGKNTIAGALNITSRKPTDEFEASIAGEYFDEAGEYGVTALMSGALGDNLYGRVVGRVAGMDGYMENTFTGNDEPETEESVVRATLVWDASEDLQVTFKAETASFDVEGRQSQIVEAGPYEDIYRSVDPAFEDELDYTKSAGGSGAFGDDYDNTDTSNFTLTLNYSLGEYELTAITSYVGFEYDNNISGDFAAFDYVTQRNEQEHSQWSQEIRLQSPIGGDFDYIVGLYYQTEELQVLQNFDFETAGARALGMPLPPFSGGRVTDLTQDTDSIALFAQGTWHLTENLQATLGLRYTSDQKDLDKEQYLVDFGTMDRNPNAALPWSPHAYNIDRTDSDVSPTLNIQYHVNEDVMVYASYAEGFKAGGFDFENASGSLASAEFEEETVTSFELGAKTTLAGGAATLNMALFQSTFSDLQVAAFNGLTFTVGNAAESVTRGLELDGQWRLSESLTLGGAIAWLDAEYDSFDNASCTAALQTSSGLGGGCIQDLSGEPLQYSPDVAGNLNLEYVRSVGNSLELSANLDINFTSGFHTALDLDPIAEQGGYAKVNARIALAEDGNWSLALVGKNLTDRRTSTWINDVPVARGAFFGFIDPPRTLGIQGSLSF